MEVNGDQQLKVNYPFNTWQLSILKICSFVCPSLELICVWGKLCIVINYKKPCDKEFQKHWSCARMETLKWCGHTHKKNNKILYQRAGGIWWSPCLSMFSKPTGVLSVIPSMSNFNCSKFFQYMHMELTLPYTCIQGIKKKKTLQQHSRGFMTYHRTRLIKPWRSLLSLLSFQTFFSYWTSVTLHVEIKKNTLERYGKI